MPFVYAPLRTKLLPTIEEAKKAVNAVNAEKDADPRPLMSILSRLPEADSRLLGLMQTRILALQGFPFDLIPSDAKNTRAVEIALLMKDRLVRSGLHHHFEILMGAIFFGIAAVRCIWASKDKEWLPTVEPLTSLDVMVLSRKPYLIIDQATFKTRVIENREQYIITTFNPFKATNSDYIGGLFRTAMWLVLIKQMNWQDWSRFNEIFAQPYRWTTYPRGGTAEEKAVARQAAEQMGSEMWAAVPDGVKMEFIEAVKTGSVQAYEKLLGSVNDELAILILGQTLTTEVKDRGSYAAASVHDRVRSDYLWHDVRLIEQAINEQYIPEDFRVNHGKDLSLRPRFAFITDETPDFEKNSRIIGELKTSGVPLKRNEVYEKTGFTMPEAGDEVI